MLRRIVLALVTVASACASWLGRPHASPRITEVGVLAPAESVYASILPPDNPFAAPLDAAYRELDAAMQPHGCASCHAPELATGDTRARVRHAVQLLDARRAIEAMVEANQMPPADGEHPAGIADPAARALLLRRAKVFRLLGDAAVARW